MTINHWEDTFQQQLERVVRSRPIQLPNGAPQTLAADLELSRELAGLDFSRESSIRSSLRAHLSLEISLIQEANRATKRRVPMLQAPSGKGIHGIHIVTTAAILLVVFLATFNQPVLAAFERWMGFGYLPNAGFFRLADSRVIKGPVVQNMEDGTSLSVENGIADLAGTRLWLTTTAPSLEMDDSWLELPDGSKLPAIAWSRTNRSGVRELSFAALSAGAGQTTLHLSGGWVIPLDWVSAAEVGLAPTAVTFPVLKSTPNGQAAPGLCFVVQNLARICVEAGIVDQDGSHVLVAGEPISSGDQFAWDAEMIKHTFQLIDEQQQIYPLAAPAEIDQTRLSLLFAGDAQQSDTVTLRLSALAFRIIHAHDQASSVTLAGQFDLGFRFPERHPIVVPTPWVIDNLAPPSPALTPTP